MTIEPTEPIEPSPLVQRAVDRVPGTVIAVCGTVVVVVVIAAFVALAVVGADATELSRVVNTVMNAAGLILGATGAVAAGVAAKSSNTAVRQTNGALDARMQAAFKAALDEHQRQSHGG